MSHASDFRQESTYSSTRVPVELASTLVPAAYHDDDYHAEEIQALWRRSWVCVGVSDQVADVGQTIVRDVGDRSIIVTRDRDDRLRAFHNVCRHRGAQLVESDQIVTAKRFRCPYHAWAYALSGECLGTPLFEGSDIPTDQQAMFDMGDVKSFDRSDYGLLPVQVASWGALVFVNLDDQAMALEEWLGDLPDRFRNHDLASWRVQQAQAYEIDANWKLIAENFMEYYHLPWVHPELIKVSRMQDHHRYQGRGMYTGMTTNPISQSGRSNWLALPPFDGLTGDELVSGRFVHVFPNVSISVLPNHAFVMILSPTGVGHTSEHTYILTHPDTMAAEGSNDAMSALAEFWDHVNREDIEIVERVQRGISTTDYPGGRMCYRFEEPLHRFQNMVIDRMVGVDRVPEGDPEEGIPVFGER